MRGNRGHQEQTKPENSEESVYQEVIIYRRVSRFIERKVQPNVGSRVLEAIEGLKDPVNRRRSIKIQGRPPNDPMFRIDKGAYRIYYKRIEGKVHVVEMENRQSAYDKTRREERRMSGIR